MNKKTPIEQERADLVKIKRYLIRLKHSINADHEINDVIPDAVNDFDARIQRGELPLQIVPSTLDEVIDGN